MRPLRTSLRTLAVSLVVAAPALAALRDPQVPVSGTALATFFASQGQTIAVVGDQQELPYTEVPANLVLQSNTFGPGSGTTAFGGYNALAQAPALYQIFPGAALAGWFTVASFRTAPIRLVVNLFDANSVIQGTTTYLGADHSAFGFYAQSPGGTFYTQDERNPGGAARILAYAGTGAHAGSTWFACELSPGPGGDFADYIELVTLPLGPVPVEHSTWGRVKRLFQ